MIKKEKRRYTPQEALYRAAALCSKCEQCENDIRKKLTDWGVFYDEADKIIDHLYGERYLDEARFVSAYCRDKIRFEGWGKIKVSYNLRLKKIDPTLIKESLDAFDEEEYRTRMTEIIKSKLRTTKKDDLQKLKASIYRFTASRGFEPNIALPIISKLLKCDVDDMEY